MSMTPEQWDFHLAPDKSCNYIDKHVEREVREYLDTLPYARRLTTRELAEALYPRNIADRSLRGDKARKRLFESLQRLTRTGLEDCCTKNKDPKKIRVFMGKKSKPWVWYRPKVVECCMFCGQPLPREDKQEKEEADL